MLFEFLTLLFDPTFWTSMLDLQGVSLMTGDTTEAFLGSCGVEFQYLISGCTFIFGVPIPIIEIVAVPLDGMCPAASMTKVGAAFSTIGYYVQSDILDFLSFGELGKVAPFIYVAAGIGAFLGVALGAPPKNYVWFVLGPTIYAFLIDTRQPVHGVEWVVAKRIQNMEEVWELAETGIVGSNYYLRLLADDVPGQPPGTPDVSKSRAPSVPSRPSSVFVWFDLVVSHIVQYMVAWTGVGNSISPDLVRQVGPDDSNISVPNDYDTGSSSGFAHNRWYLLSNLKWKYINAVTQARIHSSYLRDSFHTFMGSECGDALRASYDHQRYVASQLAGLGNTNEGPATIPESVFLHFSGDPANEDFDYQYAIQKLKGTKIPMPELLMDFMRPNLETQQGSPTSFVRSFDWGTAGSTQITSANALDFLRGNIADTETEGTTATQTFLQVSEVPCDIIFNLIMFGIRWESGHYYHQIFARENSRPAGVTEGEVLHSLFYGWDIRDEDGNLLGDGNGLALDSSGMADFRFFLESLIALHILRNEYAFTMKEESFNAIRTDSDKVQSTVIGFNRSIADRSKFGELYTWAMLVPYLQGLVLYGLAILFPFACLMMIMPGMHKALFTWMSFWAWAKLWDVGFAIVLSIERSLWAMLGNSSNIGSGVGSRLVETIKPGSPYNTGFGVPGCFPCGSADGMCAVPQVNLISGTGSPMVLDTSTALNLRFFDNLLTVGTNLDLDVSNSYYIFLISGMYLAVPAVVGQLVLGAKAGAASLATQMISGVGSEAGQAAKAYAHGDQTQLIKSSQSALGQAAYAKAMRTGLAASVLDEQNKAAQAGLERDYLQQMSGVAGQAGNQAITGYQKRQATLGIGMAVADYWLGPRKSSGLFGKTGSDGEVGSASVGSSGVGSQAVGLGSATSGGTNARVAGPAAGANGAGAASRSRIESAAGGLGRGMAGTKFGQYAQGQLSGLATKVPLAAGVGGAAGNAARTTLPFVGEHLLGPDGRTLMSQAANNDLQSRLLDANAHYGAMSTDFSVRGFDPAQQSIGHSQQGQRLEGAANYQADLARWKALNSFAQNVAGEAGAYGVFAGSLDPGGKPTTGGVAGMGMSGLLGESAQTKANFFSSDAEGGFFSQAATKASDLSSAGNYHAIHDIHRGINEGSSPWTEFANAFVVGADEATGRIGSTAIPNTGASYESYGRLRAPIGAPSTPNQFHAPARPDGSYDSPQRPIPFEATAEVFSNIGQGREKNPGSGE